MNYNLFKYFFCIVMLFLQHSNLYAFNLDECVSSFRVKKPDDGFLMFTSVSHTTNLLILPTDLASSSSQFLFSQGECRGLDLRNKEKRNYFFANFEQIKINIARANGVYIDGLISLFHCDTSKDLDIKKKLSDDFEYIFEKNAKMNTYSQAFDQILLVFSANQKEWKCK